jgi:hypothetical protein
MITKEDIKCWAVAAISIALTLTGCGSHREYYCNKLKTGDPALQKVQHTIQIEIQEGLENVDFTRTLLPPVKMKAQVVKSDVSKIPEGSIIQIRATPLSLQQRETLGFDNKERYIGVLPKN